MCPKYYQVNGKQALTEWCALTSPQRTSLLSLFTQQPCAVADCMVMNILVPWLYSARVGADVLGEASSSAPGGETGGFWADDRRSHCRVGAFAARTKDWME